MAVPTPTSAAPPRALWRTVARAILSLAVLGLLAFWLLSAAYLASVQCDDSCPDDYSGDRRFAGQLVLALATAGLTTLALVAGFGPRRGWVYYAASTSAVAMAVVWILWVPGFA